MKTSLLPSRSFVLRRLRFAAVLLASIPALPLVSGLRALAGTVPSAYNFAAVVTSDTPVPDRPGTTFAIANSTPAPAIDGNYVVFFESFYTSVLWSVNTVTGQFTRLADTTTAVPGGTSTFDSFNSYQVFNGVVVFSAAGASDPRGLFSVPVTGGVITKLVDLNTSVPGGTTPLSFDANAGPYYRLNDGGVLFGASNGVYLVPATGGAVTRISDATTHTGGNDAYNPSFGDESAGLAALTCYDTSVYGRAYLYTGLTSGFTSDGNGNATNATFITGLGSPIPDETAGDIFQLGVGNDVRVSQGTVIFTANGGGPTSGIFDSSIRGIYSSVNGVLSTLVDTSTPVPLGAGNFTIPNSGTLMPDTNALAFRDAEIAFLGMDANGTDGIYSETIPGGTLTKVFADGDPAPTGASGSGGITLGSYSVSHGKVAFLFTQEFGTTSMIVATPRPNITPTAGGDTGVVTITISGKGFVSGATVTLTAAGKPTLTAEGVAPSSTGTALAALFDLTGQADGLYDLTITNLDGSVLSYPASFIIEPGSDPVLYADVIGRAQARGGYFQTYTILCGNRGSTDAFDVPLEIVVPTYIDLEPGNFTVTPYNLAPNSEQSGFTVTSVHDPDFSRGNVVIPQIPAGQYVALTVLLKAPVDPQYAHKVFTISAQPLRPLLKPNPNGTIRPPGGGAPAFDPVPPPQQDPSAFQPSTPPAIPPPPAFDVPSMYINFPNGILPEIHAPRLPPWVDYPWPWPDDPLLPTGGYESPQIIVPGDPNDKIGSLGAGAAHYLSGSGAPLRYTIEFENEPTASASARDISITDQLDPTKVDISTFAFGPLGFGSTVVSPPPAQNQYTTTVDLRPANDLLVQINASLNVSTGLLTYTFRSLDPATSQPPTDPTAGFLPPDTSPPAGEGFVFYTVAPLKGLASGTVITNQASVVFDVNPAILTPVWSNPLDVDAPVSALASLPKHEHTAAIPLQLSGTDTGGSGIGGYNVYVSDNGGAFTLGLANVPGPTATFTGVTGHTYSFISQAEDAVLNLETLKTVAEATTKVVGPDLVGVWSNDVASKTTVAGVLKLRGHFTVTNQSPAKPAAAGAVVRFYLTSTGAVDSTATVLGKDAPFDALAAGGSEVVKLTGGKLPAGMTAFTGLYVVAVIDPDNAVTETDKTNNAVVFGPLP